jgi:hypothetical protein
MARNRPSILVPSGQTYASFTRRGYMRIVLVHPPSLAHGTDYDRFALSDIVWSRRNLGGWSKGT